MNIKGKKVVLRAIEKADLPLLQKWSNDPDTNYMLGGWHFPSSTADQERWYNSIRENKLNQRFAIDAIDIGFIGIANLIHINWKDKNAFHGIMLGEKEVRGRGYGVDSVMAIMKFAFEELGLNRLDTTIIAYNEPSIGLYIKKCGWITEGVKKNYYFRRNQWWDQLIVGITREDYLNFITQNNYWNDDQ